MPDEQDLNEELKRWEEDTGFDELGQLLLWRWDPIGLAESFPNAARQYDRPLRARAARPSERSSNAGQDRSLTAECGGAKPRPTIQLRR